MKNNSEKAGAGRKRCETRGRNPLPATLTQRRCNIFTADAPALAAAAAADGMSEPTFIANAVRGWLATPAQERVRIILGGPKMEEA